MQKIQKRSLWGKLLYKHMDQLLAIALTVAMYLLGWLWGKSVVIPYSVIVAVFVGVFTVNFTVFAICKFLVKSYHKIKETGLKRDIDAVFSVPIKHSIIGIIITIIIMSLNLPYVNWIIYFFMFYSLIASYFVFEFVYDLSVRRKLGR